MADETILMALSARLSIVHPLSRPSALREGRIFNLSNDRSNNISEIGIRSEEEKIRGTEGMAADMWTNEMQKH
jgi:hypothetical protein